jgi:hypothetical protein
VYEKYPEQPQEKINLDLPLFESSDHADFMTICISKKLILETMWRIVAIPALIIFVSLLIECHVTAQELNAFRIYKDPLGRFSLKFPITMKVRQISADEVNIYHPKASFRINISIEKSLKKGKPDAAAFIKAFKQNLKLETKDPQIIKEGEAPGIKGAQAFIIYSYTDKRGIRLTQLCQYYSTEGRFLQLIITDRAEGFKNLESVISEIHASLRILKPNLD